MNVTGLQAVLKAMKRKKQEYAAGFEKGVKKAGLFLQRKSQELVPIDTGNLRASAGTRAEGKGFQTVMYVFYTAFYAIWVHEDLYANHAAGTQAKYLEEPARDFGSNTMVYIVMMEMQGKPYSL